ncbi:MAG: hypothetical protein IPK78_16495 [Rhodospirillales bacterium]|nr:hypothetical protein [Rhodospirillales bacterium]
MPARELAAPPPLELAKRGNHAVVSARTGEDLDAVAAEARGLSGRIIPTVAGCDSHAGDSLAGGFVIPGLRETRLGGDGHGTAIALREDFDAVELRRLAGTVKDANQARRLLALAAVCDGQDRQMAARIGGMDRQTLRDWAPVQCEGPDGLINAKAPGPAPKLSAEQKEELRKVVEAGPDAETDGVVRWHPAQDPQAIEAFKKTSRRASTGR